MLIELYLSSFMCSSLSSAASVAEKDAIIYIFFCIEAL